MNRQEFLQRIGKEYRPYFDKLFKQAGERFQTGSSRSARNQGHKFTNETDETDSRTLRSPDRHALITFRLDRSLSIDRFGMEVRFENTEQAKQFLEVYPVVLDVLARQEGLE